MAFAMVGVGAAVIESVGAIFVPAPWQTLFLPGDPLSHALGYDVGPPEVVVLSLLLLNVLLFGVVFFFVAMAVDHRWQRRPRSL